MRTITPERTPNSDFGGRSFQSTGGPPINLRPNPIGFPGAPDVPRGNTLGVPEILRDTPGRRSNVTVQYARVVPTAYYDQAAQKTRQTSETEGLRPGELAFVQNDDKLAGRGKNNEKMVRLASLSYLLTPQNEIKDQNQKVVYHEQMHQTTHPGGKRPEVFLSEETLRYFNLRNGNDNEEAFLRTPFLVWRGWYDNDGVSTTKRDTPYQEGLLTDADKGTEYDDFTRVRDLWELIYTRTDERTNTALNDNKKIVLPKDEENYIVKDQELGLLDEKCMGKYCPDGFVLYKFSTEGDSQMEAMLDARQNAMYNIVIGGHATVTSWVVTERHTMRQKRLLTMPRDSIYLLVTGRFVKKGDKLKKKDSTVQETAKYSRFEDLRYVRSTSEELDKMASSERLRAGNVQLRSDSLVLGAWRLGSVVDNAAARAMPHGALNPLDVKSTMALTVSTAIRWVTSYELHETYWHENTTKYDDYKQVFEEMEKDEKRHDSLRNDQAANGTKFDRTFTN